MSVELTIKMELLTDTIFGNGMSVPGAEDTSVSCDEYGFPYYKGGTFKGVLREEFERYAQWNAEYTKADMDRLFGVGGSNVQTNQVVFSDFVLSGQVRKAILKEIGEEHANVVTEILTNTRTFTQLSEAGVAKKGSLRVARCVNQGLCFYSQMRCSKEDKELITELIESVKFIGTKRNRGFGKVKLTVVSAKEVSA